MSDQLSDHRIESVLRGAFGRPLRVLGAVGSTNDEAASWAAEGAPEGAVVIADHQTAGRGRWSRSWVSEPGRALLFSLVLRPAGRVEMLGLLTTALGVACAEGIESVTGLPTALKWPNDVTVRGKKLAGILTETRVSGSMVEAAICGIGVNVRWSPANMPEAIALRATSIEAELPGPQAAVPPREEVLAAILWVFEALYPEALTRDGSGGLLSRARERSDVLGTEVTVRLSSGQTLTGLATALLPTGALELDVAGERQEVNGGEITELRRA